MLKFSIQDLHILLLTIHKFKENTCDNSHIFLRRIEEYPPVFPYFSINMAKILYWKSKCHALAQL
jgi:hypothetical protein